MFALTKFAKAVQGKIRLFALLGATYYLEDTTLRAAFHRD
jgi:hypothetical protein